MEHPTYTHKSSIRADGSREKVRIADVAGRFQLGKQAAFLGLVSIFVVIPFLRIQGNPLILLDIEHRQFFVLGQTFNAQDIYLLFFLLTGAAFSLFYVTAIMGRIWCGWACPQTVFLEGVFRRIERLIEGPRSEQIKLAKAQWKIGKIAKVLTKHLLFLLAAIFISHLFLAYFVSLDNLKSFYNAGPKAHPALTFWIGFTTGLIYLNFSWFREQLCLIVCPYGRLQSALTDDDTLVIGYDNRRGEPRGKKNDSERGDCIDCGRCVAVCPTGIDIRNGLQLECVGCANCIDACDDIMGKIGQERGLIRYDSLNGFEGNRRRLLRPRIYLYTLLLLVGAGVAFGFVSKRENFEANILRLQGSPYLLTANAIRNQFEVHLFNKGNAAATFTIRPQPVEGLTYILPVKSLTLGSLDDRRIPFFVEMQRAAFKKEQTFTVEILHTKSGRMLARKLKFLGP